MIKCFLTFQTSTKFSKFQNPHTGGCIWIFDIWHPHHIFAIQFFFRRQKLHLQFQKFFCFCIIQNARCNRLSWIRRRMSISKEILAFPDLKIKDRKTKEEFHKFLGKSHQHLLSAFESCFWKAGHYYLCVCVTVSDFSREIESQKTTSGENWVQLSSKSFASEKDRLLSCLRWAIMMPVWQIQPLESTCKGASTSNHHQLDLCLVWDEPKTIQNVSEWEKIAMRSILELSLVRKPPFLKVFAVSVFATLTSTCHSWENVHFHLF